MKNRKLLLRYDCDKARRDHYWRCQWENAKLYLKQRWYVLVPLSILFLIIPVYVAITGKDFIAAIISYILLLLIVGCYLIIYLMAVIEEMRDQDKTHQKYPEDKSKFWDKM